MELVHAGLALAAGALTGGAAIPVLRRLPEPLDDPDVAGKRPYATLATPWFAFGVTVASAAASTLVAAAVTPWHWLAWAALTTVSVLAVAIDLRTTYLPRVLAHAGYAIAAAGVVVACVGTGSPLPAVASSAGALATGGFFWLFWRVSGGLGYGDVRLAATIGAVTALTSAELVLWSAFLGTLVGAVWSVARRLASGSDAPFAYGPALLAGPFLALVLTLALF
ncbi:prepilin peptidase [Nigerium massiliense]|uniref:prepilin peptidase n=1 Tax=Nigerium massiliense TaxID=1522317 RepID=UPI0006934263|nr:prepilin peptidase [Nigerium massiliense]